MTTMRVSPACPTCSKREHTFASSVSRSSSFGVRPSSRPTHPRHSLRLAPAAALPLDGSTAAALAAAVDPSLPQLVADLAALDSASAAALASVLRPLLSLSSLLMIVRVVLSWYPEIDGNAFPWLLAYKPTGEPNTGDLWRCFVCNPRFIQRRGDASWRWLSWVVPCVKCLAWLAATHTACSSRINLPPHPHPTHTEPVLSVTRQVIKPFNGLDVSPIVWLGLISFASEILTGPQGLLNLIANKGI